MIMKNIDVKGDRILEYAIPVKHLKLKIEDIERSLGYKNGNTPLFLKEELRAIFSELNSFNDLYGGFNILTGTRFSLAEKGFYLGDVFFNSGKVINANLRDCEYLAIFLATAGREISRRITEANRIKDYMRAYLYDAVGSEIVEFAGDYIQDQLEAEVNALGYGITNRYSPGYCGWNVAEQHNLFTFLPEGFCGITLTDSAFMLPLKSLSGIIGLGRRVVKKASGCAICTLKSCYKRKSLVN